MRVLVIGSKSSSALETFYARGLESLGHEVYQFDPYVDVATILARRVLSRALWGQLYLLVERTVERFFVRDAHWDVVIVVKGLHISARAIQRSKALTKNACWCCYYPDSPFEFARATASRHVRESIPLFDCYFIWSRSLLEPLLRAGARKVAFLPFGFDPHEHRLADLADRSLASTVSFVGTYDRQRYQVLVALADMPIRIYGDGWHRLVPWSPLRKRVEKRPIHGEELRRVVGCSAASINILRPQNKGSHNMRTFEVPAMGGVLITNRTAEQEEFFPDGIGSLMYADVSELRRAVVRALNSSADMLAIREHALAMSREHSYSRRAEQLLTTCLS